MTIFEWQSAQLPAHIQPEDFKRYLHGVWQNRRLFSSYFHRAEDDATRQPFLQFDGNRVTARGYVGFIRYEDLKINILPAVFKNPALSEAFPEQRPAFHHLLYWLSYCRQVHFPFSEVSFDSQPADQFFEVLIYIFASYTEKLIREKPWQTYEETTEETSFMRGRLAVPEYLRENLSTGRWQYLQCTYAPFLFDNLFNRIVKYTSRLLLEVSTHPRNRELLRSILRHLHEVSEDAYEASDCDRVPVNRFFEEMEMVTAMCRLFLSGRMADPAGAATDASGRNFCFLLPMEEVFEDFIAGFLGRHYGQDWKIAVQRSDLFLAKTLQSDPVFNLQQDVVMQHRQQPLLRFVLDTKYKFRRTDPQDKKAGIAQSDMYQMLGYAVSGGWKIAVLLYPRTAHEGKSNPHTFIIDPVLLKEKIKIFAFDICITSRFMENIDQQTFNSLDAVILSEFDRVLVSIRENSL